MLTPQEVEGLFKILQTLIDKGKSIIFITHKLKEVMEVADRITVLRGGRTVGTVSPKKVDPGKLASMMVGRDVNLVVRKKPALPKQVVMSVGNLFVRDERGHRAVNGLSFSVRKGEILGIAGVQGNGQTELVYALTGLLPIESGKIELVHETISHLAPRQVMELGMAHIPEDRQRHGLLLTFPLYDNLVLCNYYLSPFAKGVTLQHEVIVANGERLIKEFDIRTPSAAVNASTLSGGNQQKVIVAREFSRPIEVLIASQPTRGLDVGSIEYIHNRIIQKRDEGTAILVVSSELDEILALSDRIAVMYRGRIMEIVEASKVDKAYLGLLMAGIEPSKAAKIGSHKRKEAHEVERVF